MRTEIINYERTYNRAKTQRYDEALERYKARQEYESQKVHEFIEYLFPELKESDDEKIRKWLIGYFNQYIIDGMPQVFGNGLNVKDVIAWLGKQGEQESLCDKCKKEQPSHSCQDITELGRCAVEHEQKLADKVEPKFHQGEWITNGDYTWKIIEVKPLDYILQSQDGNIVDDTISHVDEQFHSFTIEDAKDGDVLFTSSTASHETFIFKSIDEKGNAKCYFAYDSEDGFREGKYHFIGRATNCNPATKEQRDLLFQKMKDAGYVWDSEKKELKKIEFSPDDLIEENYQQQADDLIDMVTEKPAWSEEDEYLLDETIQHLEELIRIDKSRHCGVDVQYYQRDIDWLKSLKDRVQPKQDWSEDDSYMLGQAIKCVNNSGKLEVSTEEIEDWLKFLRPQKQWKPSKEQIIALRWVLNNIPYNKHKEEISGLLDQIKEL